MNYEVSVNRLRDGFDFLSLPERILGEQGLYSTLPISEYPKHRLAKTPEGLPAILLSSRRGSIAPPPIRLMHLAVVFNVKCDVTDVQGEKSTDVFTIVKFESNDPSLQRFFFSAAGSIIMELGEKADSAAISQAVERFTELFKPASEPPVKTVLGIWGELFFLCSSSNPVLLTEAWHKEWSDRFDFSYQQQRIEVKTTKGQVRQHDFTLEQIRPPNPVTVLIISIMTQTVSVGVTIQDLADHLKELLAPNIAAMQKIDNILAKLLGSNMRAALDVAFDEKIAQRSIEFYDAALIPSVLTPLPSALSRVRFTVDLTGLPSASRGKAMEGIFSAL